MYCIRVATVHPFVTAFATVTAALYARMPEASTAMMLMAGRMAETRRSMPFAISCSAGMTRGCRIS